MRASVCRLQQIRTHLTASSTYYKKFRVAIIGSGNWGTAVAKLVAENCHEQTDLFQPEVQMWVRQEQVDGRNLTDIINSEHENVRYLPGIKLPSNLIANPNIQEVARDADILVINIPHQFLKSVCDQMEGIDYSKKVAISCLKGITVTPAGCTLLSDYIYQRLGLWCGVLSGANIATEVAKEKFSETTVAFPKSPNYKLGDPDEALMKHLFQRPYFHVHVSTDTAGVSIGGALKNVIAIGAGLVEGAGWGDNAKAAIMRRGLLEMIEFGKVFFPGVEVGTFTHESAGVADLITSCAGGRNVKIGRAYASSNKSIEQLEKELLNGQSAQGIVTCKEVHELLVASGRTKQFPLMEAIYDIICNGLPIDELPKRIVTE